MLTKMTSLPALENALFRLNFKKKRYIYEIARLEYRIWLALSKLEKVNVLILEEEENLASLNEAIKAAGKGKVVEKLEIWKTKAEYKLFKLGLRKGKINIAKLVVNQSKLMQTKEALKAIESDIKDLEGQELRLKVPVFVTIKTKFEPLLQNAWQNIYLQPNPIMACIDQYITDYLKIAS